MRSSIRQKINIYKVEPKSICPKKFITFLIKSNSMEYALYKYLQIYEQSYGFFFEVGCSLDSGRITNADYQVRCPDKNGFNEIIYEFKVTPLNESKYSA